MHAEIKIFSGTHVLVTVGTGQLVWATGAVEMRVWEHIIEPGGFPQVVGVTQGSDQVGTRGDRFLTDRPPLGGATGVSMLNAN